MITFNKERFEEEAVVICPVDPYVEDDYFKTIEALGNRAAESEASQLITQRGYCQLDDVVTNTVGMLVGWGIWKMLSSVGIAGNPLF